MRRTNKRIQEFSKYRENHFGTSELLNQWRLTSWDNLENLGLYLHAITCSTLVVSSIVVNGQELLPVSVFDMANLRHLAVGFLFQIVLPVLNLEDKKELTLRRKGDLF